MRLSEISKVLEVFATEKVCVTPLIWGQHGIGKSEVVEAVAKKLGWGFRNLRLSQIDATELVGYPFFEYDEELKQKYMDYAPPRWFLQAMRGNYVIFLDELNRAKKDVQQAVFELVLERRLGGRQLPPNVLIVAACNPSDPAYDTVDFDKAMNDRYCHILATASHHEWQEWARQINPTTGKSNVSDAVRSFINDMPQAFNVVSDAAKTLPTDLVEPSGRAWAARVDKIYQLPLSKDTKKELIRGCVGENLAIAFMDHLAQGDKPVRLDDILNDATHLESIEKGKKYSEKDEQGIIQSPLLKETCKEIAVSANVKKIMEQSMSNEDHAKDGGKTKDAAAKVLDFIEVIPAELIQSVLRDLYKGPSAQKKFWEYRITSRPTLLARLKPMQEARDRTISSK